METILEQEDVDYLIGGKRISKRTFLIAVVGGVIAFSLLIGSLYFLTRSSTKDREKIYHQKIQLFRDLMQEKNVNEEEIPVIFDSARKADAAYKDENYDEALRLINRAIEQLRRIQ